MILNGVSRAGKSTLARAVQEDVPGVWMHIGMDATKQARRPQCNREWVSCSRMTIAGIKPPGACIRKAHLQVDPGAGLPQSPGSGRRSRGHPESWGGIMPGLPRATAACPELRRDHQGRPRIMDRNS